MDVRRIEGFGPHEISQEPQKAKHLRTEKLKDKVEISKKGKEYGRIFRKALDELKKIYPVKEKKLEEVRLRIAEGFYDKPEIKEKVASELISRGIL